MRRANSTLFAPYRSMGVVCSAVRPFLEVSNSRRKMTSLYCAVDNVILHYNAAKLRVIAVSEPMPKPVNFIVSDKTKIYAATGTRIAVVHLCRVIERYIDVGKEVKFMLAFGDDLIVVDVKNGIRVFDKATGQQTLHMEGSDTFSITSIVHPSTYMNKILIGSSKGQMRIVNVRTGKLVHEFKTGFGSSIQVLEQSPAIDVLAVGLSDGRIILHNIRLDETICFFRHDKAITAVGFRNDGEPYMTTADADGHMAVWDLEKKELVGKNSVHKNAVTELYFMPGEPIMVSTSADNSLRTWILDGADGMPRQLVILEGHSEPLSDVVFSSKLDVLSSGLDGSVRKYTVNSEAKRQKLGSAGLISRADAKKKHIPIESIRLEPVVEVAIGWSREAAWDNVLCRHRDTILVTTWTTRKNSQGTHKLVHKRFLEDDQLIQSTATSIALSPCGNFAFIGYSSGHVDQFNIQSGRHIKAFYEPIHEAKRKLMSKKERKQIEKAHTCNVAALAVDGRGSELITGSTDGNLAFWSTREGRLLARLKNKKGVVKCASCPANNLLAVACQKDEDASVSIVDTLCRRVVRTFSTVGGHINALTFSSDGRWLLTADNKFYIRVWELSTSQLIDVMLFDKPCVALSFNPSGEFLATVHEDEKAIYVWANRKLFSTHVSLSALPIDYLPTWEEAPEQTVDLDTVFTSMDYDTEEEDDEEKAQQLNKDLVTFSGLAPSRWANLPNLSLIKERNKPLEAPKKVKQAPFFLTAAPTLEGFEFTAPTTEESDRKTIQAKRSLLELESSFSASLSRAETVDELLETFSTLKSMSVSAIDFQIRSMPLTTLPNFFKMLLEVLKTRIDFELVQSYMATALKIHRSALWVESDDSDELDEILDELSKEEELAWNELSNVIVDNAAVVQWVKNALL